MVQLLYRSIARDDEFSESDLDILLTALNFNRDNGITGFLWRGRGQFFQALHGPRETVMALMERIERDPRHAEVETLFEEERLAVSPFSDWAMGYDYLTEDELDIALNEDGTRPAITPAKAREIWDAMVRQAKSEAEWGTGFPYARKPAETVDSWIERLSAVRRPS